MIEVAEARQQICRHTSPRHVESVPLSAALGKVLAEPVCSDIDSPPHDKSMVDGYAIRAEDLASGSATLRLLEEVTAGDVPRHEVLPGTTTRIMTGAPLPPAADAVVMIEHSQIGEDGGQVRLQDDPARPGQNILRRATAIAAGDRVLDAGHRLRAAEIGLLAEIGCVAPRVYLAPTVAVLSTGNELVAADQSPGPGQIRNSNGPMLLAAGEQAGGQVRSLGIAPDQKERLQERLAAGLESDILIVSGGVSAGVLDLVPGCLESLGVRQVFHKVRLKPGKPVWFGVGNAQQLVFGLPGNPVSSLVCFELFVRLAMQRLSGLAETELPSEMLTLASDFRQRGNRPVFQPARCFEREGQRVVEPLRWKGSADQRTLASADCLACFPAEERLFAAGESIGVYPLP